MIYLKLIAYIVFTVALFTSSNLYLSLFVLSFSLALYLFYPDRGMRKGAVPIGLFAMSVFLSNLLLFTPGKVLVELSFLSITDGGLEMATIRAVRVIGLVFGAKLLVLSSDLDEMVLALKRLFSPLKRLGIPTEEFFDTVGLTLRMLPVVKREALRRIKRQPSEGLTLYERIGGWVNVLVPLLVDTIKVPESFLDKTVSENRNR